MSDETEMHEEAIVNTFGERLGAKIAPKGNYGFDPTIIITVIAALIQLFQNCKKPTPTQLKRRGLLVRARLNAALAKELPASKNRERALLVDDILAVADESDETEVEQFLSACCNQAA